MLPLVLLFYLSVASSCLISCENGYCNNSTLECVCQEVLLLLSPQFCFFFNSNVGMGGSIVRCGQRILHYTTGLVFSCVGDPHNVSLSLFSRASQTASPPIYRGWESSQLMLDPICELTSINVFCAILLLVFLRWWSWVCCCFIATRPPNTHKWLCFPAWFFL